ncbi:DEAD/DEAH box helicase family protein [Frigoribacterium faeni]|uniref:restriction endonuclease n=1 Tax=Frigoribacterium faeni TaxID=145483 RepID=UPI00141AD8B5|nr:DEAD/DEAH box helicase family protein [Frigoribacterium faeni]NIJ05509.1 type III restriction enzyme [Frigoribacterium faeni]
MKLHFKVQAYQTAAVDAVVDVFGALHRQPFVDGIKYKIDPGKSIWDPRAEGRTAGMLAALTPEVVRAEPRGPGLRNADLALSATQLLENLRIVQRRTPGLSPSSELVRSPAADLNLDVDMETGTGKTYVYIKTIMELHRKFGWSKYVIVVPSVAIREGVKKSFEITAEHFLNEYNRRVRAFVYDSDHIEDIETFSSDDGIQVMIINAQNFNRDAKKSAEDVESKGKSSGLRMFRELDGFKSRRPIDVIAANRPILIIDEPQRLGSDPKKPSETLKALRQFNALFALRYSATHKIRHNTVHRLDALDAYNNKLVKKIAAKGISVKGLSGTSAYLYLDGIELGIGADFPKARLELEWQPKGGGTPARKTFKVRKGSRLYDLSGELEAYKGLVVDEVDAVDGKVTFIDGQSLLAGDVVNDSTEEQKRRIQIREVVRAHLDKERQLFPLGIKVLSLFFIDEVVKYRDYLRPDQMGDYARMFEEEYVTLRDSRLEELDLDKASERYRSFLERDAVGDIHNGYFSKDKTGKWVNSDAGEASDEKGKGLSKDAEAYDAILRDKEKLLDQDFPLRFIFSHSALREGWDSPNVFTLGFLKKATAGDSRRQEVGRGLRLAVDHDGDRTDNPDTVHQINVLTVVTEESYVEFVAGFQKETLALLSARPRTASVDFFTGAIVAAAPTGADHKITAEESKQLLRWLQKHEFVDLDDHLAETWLNRSGQEAIPSLPEALVPYTHQVIELIDSLNVQATPVDDARKPKIQRNNANFKKQAFLDLWDRINRRVTYEVHFDSKELIDNSISALDLSLHVTRLRYEVIDGVQQDMIEADALAAGGSFKVTRRQIAEFELTARSSVTYDLLGEVAEKTDLTRRTCAAVLAGVKPNTFEMFRQNPEQFINEAARIINEQKAQAITAEHVEYHLSDDRYNSSIIFPETLDATNFEKAVPTPNRNVYEYLIDDSGIERAFGAALDISEDVIVYTKLPRGFRIPTPISDYIPDWAIAFREGSIKHVFFVAETKGDLSTLELRTSEQKKIDYARKLFAKLNEVAGTPDVKYDVVTNYDQLIDIVGA